jgi:hypothetical protein
MSAELILLPLLEASMQEVYGAASVTGTLLGYQMQKITPLAVKPMEPQLRNLELEIKNSEVVAEGLDEEEELQFKKDTVTITFRKDERRRLSVCVSGVTKTEEELRQLGNQFAQGLVQQYVYQKIKRELQRRKFTVAQEETTPENVIRLTVRHW